MKVEGYVGICAECFEPIKKGEEFSFRSEGRKFHRRCVDDRPNGYYVALERIEGRFEQGENPTELMNEMEAIFKVPAMNNESFNEDNEGVIKVYRKLSDARKI